MSLRVQQIILLTILLLAFFFRFFGLNWDQDSHLHPDERFLTMVATEMKIPKSISDYFDPTKSTFNPPNIGFPFYVYGVSPVTLNKMLALVTQNDSYNKIALQGRFLSALADTAVLFFIFLFLKTTEKKYKFSPNVKFLATFIYACSILPIQLSHFFAVDTFLNLFLFASFYFSFSHFLNRKKTFIVISAIFFGLALSSKISAIYVAPLIIFFAMNIKRDKIKESITDSFINLLIFGAVSFFILKFTDPYLFASGWLIDPRPNTEFLKNIAQLKMLADKNSFFPPTVQWITKTPLLFPLKNLVLWGFGIPSILLSILGFVVVLKSKHLRIFGVIILWILLFVIYQGIQTTPTMRYFLLAYPYLSIFAGFGLFYFFTKQKIIFYILIFLVLLYPLMFISIYTKQHTRVEASYWIEKNIPPGSTILSEHWDDSLPVGPVDGSIYNRIEMPVFDPDSPQKRTTLNNLMKQGDYIILSSNRGWGSIPTVPERYPEMSKFYNSLISNKTEYKMVKEFISYPSLSYLGIPITVNDDSAEEAFTVYDHPKVMIFKRVNN